MKKSALAIVLVICMVLSMLPMTAFAAPQTGTAGYDLPFVQVSAGLKTDPKPIGTDEPNAKEYTLTVRTSENGYTAVSAVSAAKGEIIYIEADPHDGYLAYFDTYGDDLDLVYIGYNLYQLTMPGHNVSIDVYYKPAEGEAHNISVKSKIYANHAIDYIHYEAKAYESIFIMIELDSFVLLDVQVISGGQNVTVYYLGEIDGKEAFEFFMPDGDAEIIIDTLRTFDRGISLIVNGTAYDSNPPRYAGSDGSISFTSDRAKPGEQVTFTAAPMAGYTLTRLELIYTSPWDYGIKETFVPEYLGNNTYTFTMPDERVDLYADFEAVSNPLSVTVETGLGGTAFLSHTEAMVGDTVNLYCYPDDGYRVAQITGVDGLVDNGDGSYTFTMPAKAVDIKVLFLREENPFLDVNETHFFYTPVLWAVEEGITSGMTPETFGPFGICNRAQVVTFLWRYAGSPKPTTAENPFTDVPEGSFYYDAVLWAVENGITMGVSTTEFGPGMPCNRAQVVTFLWRLMEEPAPELSEHPFTDVDAGSFYELPVLWALENGITTGATATTFNPNGECQRAQVVTFLYRADQIPEPEVPLA